MAGTTMRTYAQGTRVRLTRPPATAAERACVGRSGLIVATDHDTMAEAYSVLLTDRHGRAYLIERVAPEEIELAPRRAGAVD